MRGWRSHQHHQVHGTHPAPLHPRQVAALGWFPGTFCPGHAQRAQRERGGRPLSQQAAALGIMRLCSHCAPLCSTHHSGQAGQGRAGPGRAGAGGTPRQPLPTTRRCCTSPSLPGDTGEQEGQSVRGRISGRWQPARTREGRERQAGKPGHRCHHRAWASQASGHHCARVSQA